MAQIITNDRFIQMMKLQMLRSKEEAQLRFIGKRVKFPGTKNTAVYVIEEISMNMNFGIIFRLKNGTTWFADFQLVFLEENQGATSS